MTITDIQKQIMPILRRRKIKKAALFGSAAKGKMSKKSDIDLVVDLPEDYTLLDLIGLKIDLEQKSGRKIDILTYKSINPLLKDIILNEQKVIYEKRS